ncbi:hypothetical protein B0H14DRAFT_2565892 [Mycena olivaceomarginata]|nr:hypothetical protein B0H14DRAFT_2565892 [Mycena olivaceomarginata]
MGLTVSFLLFSCLFFMFLSPSGLVWLSVPPNSHTRAGWQTNKVLWPPCSSAQLLLQSRAEIPDLGPPIVCSGYNLEAGLQHENTAQMACEDSGSTSEDKDELEDAIPTANSSHTDQRSTVLIGPTAALTGTAKKKEQNTTPPLPTPQALDKAAQSTPIAITFAANNFHASKPWWTGKTHVILDRKGRIIGVLIAPPVPGEKWHSVLKVVMAAMHEACDKMSFPASAYHHRWAYAEGEGFPTAMQGFSFSSGREKVGNIKVLSAKNTTASEGMLNDPNIVHTAIYPICE